MRKMWGFSSFIIIVLALVSVSLKEISNNYRVNKDKSIVLFKIDDKLGTTRVGYFSPPKGTIVFDKSNLSNSKFKVVIDINSINTNDEKRDKDLLSSDFFEADKYPTMSFESKSFTLIKSGFEVTGNMKIKDVTKEITIPFNFREEKDGPYFESEFKLYRLDYGVGSSTETISNDVYVRLKIAVK